MRNRDSSILKRVDGITVGLFLILVFMGWLNIYSAVLDENNINIFDVSQKYGKQMLWIIAAFVIGASILIIDSKFYSVLSYPIYIFVILLIIATYFLAPEIKGARAWFEIGSFRLQPSEFSKLATSLVLARYLSGYGVKLTTVSGTIRATLILLIPMLLIILQNDTGSALVYGSFMLVFYRLGMSGWILLVAVYTILIFSFSIIFGGLPVANTLIALAFIIFYFVAKNLRIKNFYVIVSALSFLIPWGIIHFFEFKVPVFTVYLIGLLALMAPAIVYIYKKKSHIMFFLYFITFFSLFFSFSVNYIFNDVLGDHQQSRIRVFFGMESDPLGLEFNVNQSKIAIGSGDLFGKGFLQGTQTKNNFVPEQSTDFIFCTVGEEWGFVGSSVVIILFVILLLRIMFLAEKQRSMFSKIYGYCVASIFFFHLLINVGMTIGLMPVIGIPLPFFSYGGSSLWGFTMLLFIFIKLDSDRDVLIQ